MDHCKYTIETDIGLFSTEAEFLDKIQTKDLRVFLLSIHSHLYSCALRFLFLHTHATSYVFPQIVKEKGGKPYPFPMV
jgi:phosphopantetheinyl transferase